MIFFSHCFAYLFVCFLHETLLHSWLEHTEETDHCKAAANDFFFCCDKKTQTAASCFGGKGKSCQKTTKHVIHSSYVLRSIN